ncbi:vWA domain-containing protein [Solidesulfovibrio sp.]
MDPLTLCRRMAFAACLCTSLALRATPSPARTIELVLDASGSMAARLPSGERKIDAAKKAVTDILAGLPVADAVALRVYGHQSETARRDCLDTALLVPFGPAGQSRPAATTALADVAPRGYTPITYALKRAAEDFKGLPAGPHRIVLISDGKETCPGDPCALAAALAKADAELVIHVVGFAVDAAAGSQLQCIAEATGGTYHGAQNAAELAAALAQTTVREPPQPAPAARTISLPRNDPGTLTLVGANLAGHAVTNADTNAQVATLSQTGSTATLPAGIYTVAVGKVVWKSIVVKPGQTTTLRLARLGVQGASSSGHAILDPETGEKMAAVSATGSSTALMPGRYLVAFGQTRWPVELVQGQQLTLTPGLVTVRGAPVSGWPLVMADGSPAATVSATQGTVALPPGDYVLDTPAGKVPFSLKEGDRLDIK